MEREGKRKRKSGVRALVGAAAGLSAILFLAPSAAADAVRAVPLAMGNSPLLPPNTVDIGEETLKILGLARGGDVSVEVLHQRAKATYEDGMPETRVVGRPVLSYWRVEKDLGEPPASVSDLIAAAHERLDSLKDRLPEPSVAPALAEIDELQSQGQIHYDPFMPSNELGLYVTRCEPSKDAGSIRLYPDLKEIATFVGRPLVDSVLFHEACHAEDANICGESVEDREARAFKCQYDYLKSIYPTSDELATTWEQLTDLYRRHPEPIVGEAIKFIDNMNHLYGTDGQRSKIIQLVQELYNSDGTPSSPAG